MAKNDLILRQLNDLASRGVSATINKTSFGWSTLLRYEPLVKMIHSEFKSAGKEKDAEEWLNNNCYVFEIGKNLGDVFSVNLVRSIEITNTGAIIHLKP